MSIFKKPTETEPETEIEEHEDPESYSHDWTCANCGAKNTHDIEFGRPTEEAIGDEVLCKTCGCY